jgi:oligopeptide/dipeptide ABC transporter ATP-binding protein
MADQSSATALLSAKDLRKNYGAPSTALGGGGIRALDGVSLDVAVGETLGVVGESGSGKTTLAKLLIGREQPTSGSLQFRGRDLLRASGRQLRALRRHIQIVLQDSSASLDPRMRVAQIVSEPWRYFPEVVPRQDRAGAAEELLRRVGLDVRLAGRYPHELSGGQRQRVSIARALALRPEMVICDEPCSALDVSVQAQILNLLMDLQEEFQLSYVFISHNLSVAEYVSDRIVVMYLGRIVESGDQAEVYGDPRHPYTQALLSAVPAPVAADGEVAHVRRIVLQGEPPDPRHPPSGCRFRTRCWKAQDICRESDPLLGPVGSGGHLAACHFAGGAP